MTAEFELTFEIHPPMIYDRMGNPVGPVDSADGLLYRLEHAEDDNQIELTQIGRYCVSTIWLRGHDARLPFECVPRLFESAVFEYEPGHNGECAHGVHIAALARFSLEWTAWYAHAMLVGMFRTGLELEAADIPVRARLDDGSWGTRMLTRTQWERHEAERVQEIQRRLKGCTHPGDQPCFGRASA